MENNISDEELGIKSFHLRRGRVVEQSIEKIRQKLGNDWKEFTYTDTQTLHWILGEVWSFIARDNWDKILFSELELKDIKNILVIAEAIMQHKKIGGTGLEEINKILNAKKLTSI
ncbi:MAG: hypothetical protein ABII25_08860 [bacterium]